MRRCRRRGLYRQRSGWKRMSLAHVTMNIGLAFRSQWLPASAMQIQIDCDVF